MRTITDHIIEGDAVNHLIHVSGSDRGGPGGGSHEYLIQIVPLDDGLSLKFQKGDPANGINGITDEVLLAILIDRWRGFLDGPISSTYTAEALEHGLKALECLKARTIDRIQRGVYCTYQK